MNVNKLINEINIKTCNKFNFLKLKQVFFDAKKNECEIILIYPSYKTLSDEDKREIAVAIKEFLKLDSAKINVKINKSFIEPDLIEKEVLSFFNQKNPVVYNALSNQTLKVEVDSQIPLAKISITLEEDLLAYFNKFALDKNLIAYLDNRFCCSFEVSTFSAGKTNFSQEFLENRFSALTKESDLNAIMNKTIDKYFVTDKKLLIGNDINFNPRYISSIKSKADTCVVAGTINFLTEKTYKSKRTKTKKDGTKEEIIKPFFNFQLKDSSGSILAVIFPSKANYHKMHLLKNGDTIIVKGKIDTFNDKFEICIKDISLCKIPSKTEIQLNVNQNEITEYRFVKPVKYNSFKQSNIFENSLSLSNEIRNQTYIVYDFETTGVNPESDEIIEIGALKIVNGVFTEVFSTLVKPKKLIPAEATKINRITNEMVANCYSIEQIICDFYLFCKDCQMVGYNSIAFDSLFLKKAGKLVGLNFDNTQIDAFLLAKDKLKGLRNYKLATVSKYLEVDLIDAHRALNDVIATAEVFIKLY